jgi:NADPH-dependent glutamate synthase beta subunit-like oxidoreductase
LYKKTTDPSRLITNFQDFFSPVSFRDSLIFKTGSQRSERPIFLNKTSPCRQACPIGIDIPAAFHRASKGEFDEALRIYLQENPLPGICGRVCYHPCELDCNRKDFDNPVNIRGFERFLSDHAQVDVRKEVSIRAKKKKIAVIGSGPAGLSASYHLAKSGYSVSLFEARHEIGGMLRYGIPTYRLPRPILDREIERILSLGIETHLDTDVGEDLRWNELESFDAVFISPGLQLGKMLFEKEAPNDSIFTGLDFLANPRRFGLGKGKVLIVGGGNVAIDVARTLIRLRRGRGKEITLICPESREQMPALSEEVKEALEEGITVLNGWAPQKINQKRGKQLTVEFSRAEVERDEATGRVRIIPVGTETQKHFADKIVIAIGQAARPFQLSEKILVKEEGMVTDQFGRASLPKIFAGGDIKGGKAFVADAIASGKMGAMAISCFLEGKDVEAEFQRCQLGNHSSFSFQHFIDPHHKNSVDFKRVVSFDRINTLFFYESSRNRPEELEAAERIRTFEEVNSGFASGQAEDEISRCFKCGTCIDCENCLDFCPDLSILRDAELGLYGFDEDHCKGCGICSVACPRNVVEMVIEKNENVLDR